MQIRDDIIPEDDTTLFICSGMQPFKQRFRDRDGGRLATLQSCVRTNDLDLVGDGSHLTYFEMLGHFHFGRTDEYEYAIDLWAGLLDDLGIGKDCLIHVHPLDWNSKRILWEHAGFGVVADEGCVWSDGDIGGMCCEVYWKGVEIGNLVNPLGTCTDVGFGLERLVMAAENKTRVDETSLFDVSLPPVARDHVRCLNAFWRNGIPPGNKGRNYVCRRLLRRLLPFDGDYVWRGWLEDEKALRAKCLDRGAKMWKRHKDKPPRWWWETCGLTEDDLILVAGK